MKNLIYFFIKPSLRYWLTKNLITFLTIILILLTQQGCSPTEPPDDKPPVEPDSTTQNFTFETYEFGNGFESSWLEDVWIFDENNIWAVGYVREPITNNNSMNIIRWNGSKWYGFGRQFNSSGIYGIWGLDSANIFFAVGAVVQYKNGSFIEYNLGYLGFTNGQGVHKLWGSSESNIWGVGPWGTIVHYDGFAWSKIEFDQQWYFYGITGNKNTGTAYTVASGNQGQSIILELKDNGVKIIFNTMDAHYWANGLQTIVQYSEDELWLARNNVFSYNLGTEEFKELEELPLGVAVSAVSKRSEKDVYHWGNGIDRWGKLVHYNGKRFTTFTIQTGQTAYPEGIYAIDNLAVAVGSVGNKAFLVKVLRK